MVVDYIINLSFRFKSPTLRLVYHNIMDSATDTDSEVGHSDVASYPTQLAPSPSFESAQTDKRLNLKDVHAALQDLKTVDTRLLIKVIQHISLKRTYAN